MKNKQCNCGGANGQGKCLCDLNNPREQAIEKLAVIFHEKSISGYLTHEENKHIAALALDALNIEVVSRENLPKNGDRIINTNTGSHLWFDGSENHIRIANSKYNIIVCRNYKPAVYVENIGVKL